jgi:hypothetical protein
MTDKLHPTSSDELKYRRVKWQVTEEAVAFMCKYDYGLPNGFSWLHPHGYYGVSVADGTTYLVAFVGCAWDGATKYPDFLWMMAPSLKHDILHWLIKRGIIEEHYNDVIDLELYYAILEGKEPIPLRQGGNSKFVRKLRAHLILRATNTADEVTDTSTADIEVRKVKI